MDARPEFVLTTPVLPWPADQGSKIFLLDAARALAELGRVILVTREIGDEAAAIEALRDEGFDLRIDRSFRSQDFWSRLRRRVGIDSRAFLAQEPRACHFVVTPVVRRLVAEALAEFPDAWCVGAYWTTSRVLEAAPRGKRVLIAADVESAADASRASLVSTSAGRRSSILRRAERKAFLRADLLGCLTLDDMASAKALLEDAEDAHPTIGLWPTAIDLPVVAEGVLESPLSRILVYGHWEAAFNRDGLEWFLREIWPQVHAARPESRLRLVGRGADRFEAVRGVDPIGYVEDLGRELARCDAVFVPLRYAGGLRYRLLEAMAARRPVVATGVAASGSGAAGGEHYLRAETVREWIEALERLDDSTFASSLVDRARLWVEQHFGAEGRTARLSEFLSTLIDFERSNRS